LQEGKQEIGSSWPWREILASGMAASIALAGCDPIVSIGGANLPDWLICLTGGAALAALFRPLLIVVGFERYLRPLVIFYGSLMVLFALTAWILFFNQH
jgi:YtcA family